MLTSLCIRIALLNADEIRCSNGLVLTSMDQDVVKATNVSVSTPTNCVNCGAVIDPNVDHCEYCGTSYRLMGISCAPKTERRARLESDRLQVENELLRAKTKALSDAEEIKVLYEDALNAMRSYRSRY